MSVASSGDQLLDDCSSSAADATSGARRTLQQSIAQWLEDQGGLPLYTVEGTCWLSSTHEAVESRCLPWMHSS